MEQGARFNIFPPSFDVRNKNAKRFYKRFERFIAVQKENFNDALKINLLANLLCDRSFDFFESLPADTKQNYDETETAILNHYNYARSETKQWSLLNNRRQLLNEDVTQYYDQLISMASEINVIPENILYLFLNGIHSDIKHYVTLLPNPPENIQAALRAAKHYETIYNDYITHKYEVLSNNNVPRPEHPNPPENTNETLSLEKKIETVENDYGIDANVISKSTITENRHTFDKNNCENSYDKTHNVTRKNYWPQNNKNRYPFKRYDYKYKRIHKNNRKIRENYKDEINYSPTSVLCDSIYPIYNDFYSPTNKFEEDVGQYGPTVDNTLTPRVYASTNNILNNKDNNYSGRHEKHHKTQFQKGEMTDTVFHLMTIKIGELKVTI